MAHFYYGARISSTSRKVSDDTKILDVVVELVDVDNKFTVVQLFEENEGPNRLCLGTIPIRIDPSNPVTKENWLIRLLKDRSVPVGKKIITLEYESKYLWSFEELSVMFSTGYYFLEFRNSRSLAEHFVVAVKDDSVNAEMMRPISDYLIFESPENFDKITVGHTQSRIVIVAQDTENNTSEILTCKFNSPLSLEDVFEVYLTNGKIDLNPYIFGDEGNIDSTDLFSLIPKSYKNNLGKSIVSYLQTPDGRFKISLKSNPDIAATTAVLLYFRDSEQTEDLIIRKEEFESSYISLLGSDDADVMRLCISVLEI